MKKLGIVFALTGGFISTSISQITASFNVDKFEKELIKEMEKTFPGMTLDTTLRFVTRATSQEEAKFHESYTSSRGGMVNTSNSEENEAQLLVQAYRKYLLNTLYFDDKALARCRFTEFCATATLQYGGLVRYGVLIDNNITRESLMNSSEE